MGAPILLFDADHEVQVQLSGWIGVTYLTVAATMDDSGSWKTILSGTLWWIVQVSGDKAIDQVPQVEPPKL